MGLGDCIQSDEELGVISKLMPLNMIRLNQLADGWDICIRFLKLPCVRLRYVNCTNKE